MQANEYQVGGNHYSQAGRYQHWDFIEDHGIGYLEGYATKYLVRWDKKGMPVQDLEKAQHITAKLIELSESGKRKNRAFNMPTRTNIGLFCSANKVKDEHTHKAIELLFMWSTTVDLEEAFHHVKYVLEAQPARRIAREYSKEGKKRYDGMEHPFGYDAKEEGATEDIYKAAAEKIWSAPGADGPEPGRDPETKKE